MSAGKISNVGQKNCGDLNFLKWSFLDFHCPAVCTKSCLLPGRTQCLVRGRKLSRELLDVAQVPLTFSVCILENKEWRLSPSVFGRNGSVDNVNLYSALQILICYWPLRAWHSAQQSTYPHKIRDSFLSHVFQDSFWICSLAVMRASLRCLTIPSHCTEKSNTWLKAVISPSIPSWSSSKTSFFCNH